MMRHEHEISPAQGQSAHASLQHRTLSSSRIVLRTASRDLPTVNFRRLLRQTSTLDGQPTLRDDDAAVIANAEAAGEAYWAGLLGCTIDDLRSPGLHIGTY